MIETIHILHTNDLHSHFENWPRMRRFLIDQRNTLEAKEIETLTVDLGDFMDRYHPLTDVTSGIGNIEVMNQVMYDFATIGNNEGITLSKQELNELYDGASFSVILANLLDKETMSLPEWASPYKIHTTKEGTRIGVIALTTPINLTYEPFGWHAVDPEACLKEWLPEVKAQSDIVVLMSHLGLPDDKVIAETFSDIDVIIESHTHHLLKDGLMWHDCLLASAGRFGEFVGEVLLEVENKALVSKQAKTYETAKMEEKTRDIIEVANYKMQGENLLKQQKIGVLPKTLAKETDLMTVTLKAMKEYANVDVALLNTGVILTDLEKGVVTRKDIHECLPHPMNLIKVTLAGRDVIRLVYEIERIRDYLFKFPIVGMKFRGKYFGKMCYDGLNYCKKTKEVMWLGQTINEDQMYDIVTVDHLSFLPFFPTIELAGDVRIISSDFLRTIVGDYLENQTSRK